MFCCSLKHASPNLAVKINTFSDDSTYNLCSAKQSDCWLCPYQSYASPYSLAGVDGLVLIPNNLASCCVLADYTRILKATYKVTQSEKFLSTETTWSLKTWRWGIHKGPVRQGRWDIPSCKGSYPHHVLTSSLPPSWYVFSLFTMCMLLWERNF